MRIVFLASDDEFAGAMQRCVYQRHQDWIAGSVISTCVIYKKSRFGAFFFILKKSGPRFLSEMIRMKILRRIFSREHSDTPSRLARKSGIPIHLSANINSQDSLDAVASWKPDLVISTNFNHYIGGESRGIASVGTWNLHKSFLPEGRGMAPNFYALLDGSECTGVTLHVVSPDFDAGDIIVQRKVPIENTATLYSLNRATAHAGGDMLADYLEDVDLDELKAYPQPDGDWVQHTYPKPREIREFRKMGCKF